MNTTIARLSLQSLLGQRRGLVVVVLPVVLLLLAAAIKALGGEDFAFEPVVVVFGMGLVLPLVALLVTNGVLGPEIDDGSIVYLLSKPISRYVVAISKLVVAVAVTVVVGAGSLLVAGLILSPGEPGQALACFVGGAVAGAAYCSVFVMLSAINRHGMVGGLIYVLGFEALLANLLVALRNLSVGAFGRRIAEGLDSSLQLPDEMSLVYAWLASVVVIVAGGWVAGQRLRAFQLRGDE